MFEELIEIARSRLEKNKDSYTYENVLELATSTLITSTREHESETIKACITDEDACVKRNRERWKSGFQKLRALRETSIQAGMNFQKHFLQKEEYQHDVLYGVLMRQHAHACRISGEIIVLLEAGYADGAIARWRTLYEISVTCLIIKKYGRNAASDYVKHGIVKNSEGILEYQKTAEAMGLPPFSREEVEAAEKIKEEITDGDRSWHWARRHAGVSKLEKLREIVGLDNWSHNYKLASRNIHSDYYEMDRLHAMSEAKQDLLLVGQSNSGMTAPAHFTAINLAIITSVFILVGSDDDQCELDFTDSILFMKVIDNYIDEVGRAFIAIEQRKE